MNKEHLLLFTSTACIEQPRISVSKRSPLVNIAPETVGTTMACTIQQSVETGII